MAYLLLGVIFLSGCFFETSESIPFGSQNQTTIIDKEKETLFDPNTTPTGMICAHDFAEGAACDPVLQDCGADHFCGLAFDADVGRARAVCKPKPEKKLVGVQGEPCDGHCAVGFLCSSGVCKRFCELKTGFGCKIDQFCDDPFAGTHGVCSEACR